MDTRESKSAAGGPAPGDAPAALGAAGSRATTVGAIAALAGVGAAAVLAVTDHAMRPVFLYAYLIAFVYYLSITLGAQFFVLVQHLCRAGWSVTVRRIAEALMGNLPLLVLLFLPVLLALDELYPWARAGHGHEALSGGKAAYLSATGFVARCAVYFAVWGGLAWFLRSRSTGQDADGDPARTLTMERVAGPATIAFFITTTFASFDLLMSLDPHWVSTVFGIYFFSGGALAAVVAIALAALWMKRNGVLADRINDEHYHDLGKLIFAGVCFWGYIALCQYLLIWYGNMPEETRFLIPRQIGPWAVVSGLLAACHLGLPFFALISRHSKRRLAWLAVCCVWLLAAHALDLFWLVMPSVFVERIPELVGTPDASLQAALATLVSSNQAIYQIAGRFPEAQAAFALPLGGRAVAIVVAMLVGMGGVYWVNTVRLLGKAALAPVRDPRLSEAMAFENT